MHLCPLNVNPLELLRNELHHKEKGKGKAIWYVSYTKTLTFEHTSNPIDRISPLCAKPKVYYTVSMLLCIEPDSSPRKKKKIVSQVAFVMFRPRFRPLTYCIRAPFISPC